jgi:hypothetical protein
LRDCRGGTAQDRYEHGDSIYATDLDGSHPKKIAARALPDISPDGTKLAFNTDA